MSGGFPMARVTGHRGAAGLAPENTLEALDAAAAAGARWVEVDVRHSADGVPLIFHDDDLARCTGASGAPEDHPWRHLAALDAGRWFHPRFTGARLPSLEALLVQCRELDLGVNLELKLGPRSRREVLVSAATACLAAVGAPPRGVLVSSFDVDVLSRWRDRRPNDPVGLICERLDEQALAAAIGLPASTVHPRWQHLRPIEIEAAHAAGLGVHAWTCNRPRQLARLWVAGLDGVITDRPDRFRNDGLR